MRWIADGHRRLPRIDVQRADIKRETRLETSDADLADAMRLPRTGAEADGNPLGIFVRLEREGLAGQNEGGLIGLFVYGDLDNRFHTAGAIGLVRSQKFGGPLVVTVGFEIHPHPAGCAG